MNKPRQINAPDRKVMDVKQLKAIRIDGLIFPISCQTRLKLDTRSPRHYKRHHLVYQQEAKFGTPGDATRFLTHDELFQLEAEGMIKIKSVERRKV